MKNRNSIGLNLITRALLITCVLALIVGCAKEQSVPVTNKAADTTAAQSGVSALAAHLTYEQRQGRKLYMTYCTVCHGDHGEGDGFNAYNLDPKPHSLADSAYVAALSDATLAQVISLGGRGVNKSVLMPAYQYTLKQDEIAYLVAYIRTFTHAQKP